MIKNVVHILLVTMAARVSLLKDSFRGGEFLGRTKHFGSLGDVFNHSECFLLFCSGPSGACPRYQGILVFQKL